MRRWPTVNLKEGENPWVTYFKKQVYAKNNCINAICTGMPGKGKSWSLLYLLSQSDDSFDVDRIFFRASKMLRWIDQGGLKKGRAFLFDEAGIDASNLNWWDEINKGLNAFLQTGRSDNYIFGLSVPMLNMVSKGVRTLMNVKMEAEGWTPDNLTLIKPYVFEYNGEMDKFYRKRLLVKNNGSANYCNMIKIPKADQKLLDEYEKLKKEFKSDLYQKTAGRLERHERASLGLTHRQMQYYDLADSGFDRNEICEQLKIEMITAYQLEQRIRQRGVLLPDTTPKDEKKDTKYLEN